MKQLKVLLAAVMVLGAVSLKAVAKESPKPTAVATVAASPELTMSVADWKAYKEARAKKDWALCEKLTVYPDVKAWDAQNQGQQKLGSGDYEGATQDFHRALDYAVTAEKIGRTKDMDKLRAMVRKALKVIQEEGPTPTPTPKP